MECLIEGVTIHAADHGAGVPLVALHGAGVDHREIEAAVEAVVPATGYRRIYPDLPGMGRSTADGLTSNDDVVGVLAELIDRVAGGPALLLGHSYGGYLAGGIAARRPELVLGLALVCPVGAGSGELPAQRAVRQDPGAYAELDPALRPGFDAYFVVRTAATARRYRDHVVPGTTLADETALGRIFARWSIDVGAPVCTAPTLIVAGREDSTAGYRGAVELLDRYPAGTLAVVDGAGHALVHERPELFGALLDDWLARAASREVANRRPAAPTTRPS
jgi:pimeloyl-ACP methyl ester carboxylesterase